LPRSSHNTGQPRLAAEVEGDIDDGRSVFGNIELRAGAYPLPERSSRFDRDGTGGHVRQRERSRGVGERRVVVALAMSHHEDIGLFARRQTSYGTADGGSVLERQNDIVSLIRSGNRDDLRRR